MKKETEIKCEIRKTGELTIDGKKFLVDLTDIKQEIEAGRIRHTFVLTEII